MSEPRGTDGRRFVAAQNFDAQTHRHYILENVRAAEGGWHLADALPDTDQLSGMPMTEDTFATSRWQQNASLVLKHVMKAHEGGLVELEGQWVRGHGDVPDALFDPQFGFQ